MPGTYSGDLLAGTAEMNVRADKKVRTGMDLPTRRDSHEAFKWWLPSSRCPFGVKIIHLDALVEARHPRDSTPVKNSHLVEDSTKRWKTVLVCGTQHPKLWKLHPRGPPYPRPQERPPRRTETQQHSRGHRPPARTVSTAPCFPSCREASTQAVTYGWNAAARPYGWGAAAREDVREV